MSKYFTLDHLNRVSWTEEGYKYIVDLHNGGMTHAQIGKLLSQEYGHDFTLDVIKRGVIKGRMVVDVICDDLKLYKDTYRANLSSKTLRKDNNVILSGAITLDDIMSRLTSDLIPNLNKPRKLPKNKVKKSGSPMTIELLFSDLQIGKIMKDYNSDVALRRIQKYTQSALFKIEQHIKSGYQVEKIVLAILGDIIESSEKHKNSARATDCGTPEQIQKAIEYLHLELIYPIAATGIPLEVICVTGNHDHNDHGLQMFRPGREHYSWVIYKALELIGQRDIGLNAPVYHIPEGAFYLHKIYGHNILYEHGVGVSATESAMNMHLNKRIKQVGEFITYFRMGDKHNISRFNEDTLVVNGAFFGGDKEGVEYSGIMGYHACAGQIMFCWVPRGDERLPIYDSFIIQLQHIK